MFNADLSTDKSKKKKVNLPDRGSLFDYLFKIN
jgi:hypothetical protein